MSMMIITQDYFDEVCLENAELFDDDGEQQIVEETVQQLKQQVEDQQQQQQKANVDNANIQQKNQLNHLTLTFPNSPKGLRERTERDAFLFALNRMHEIAASTFVNPEMNEDEELATCVKTVRDKLSSQTKKDVKTSSSDGSNCNFHLLFCRSQGFARVFEAFRSTVGQFLLVTTTVTSRNSRRTQHQEDLLQSIVDALFAALILEDDANKEQLSNKGTNYYVQKEVLRSFQDAAMINSNNGVTTTISSWIQLFQWLLDSVQITMTETHGDMQEEEETFMQKKMVLLHRLLEIAYWSTKRCEANKKAWMKQKQQTQNLQKMTPDRSDQVPRTTTTTLGSLIVQTLDVVVLCSKEGVGNGTKIISTHPFSKIVSAVCRLLSVLCTFDDFSGDHTSTGGSSMAMPMSSSAHANVQTLLQTGPIVVLLHQIMKQQPNPEAVLALRSLTATDTTVKACLKEGVLDTANSLLQDAVFAAERGKETQATIEERKRDESKHFHHYDYSREACEMATACLGLFRNLAANDNIKSKLCHHLPPNNSIPNLSVCEVMVQAMTAWPEQVALQEHALGLTAAVTLRQPENARFLVSSCQVHIKIVSAMRLHRNSATLNRQAALALRNLVSRCTDLRSELLQADVEQALRSAAAKHVAIQDEVYAALRDLGLTVTMVQVVQQDDAGGKVMVQPRTVMFGEQRNSNFRPVFD